MDSPDWLRLTQLVEEYGHGAIVFVDDAGEEFTVDEVEFDPATENIYVRLS